MTDEIPSNDVVLEQPVVETTVETPKEKFDGLPKREALEEAMKIHREGKDIAEVRNPTTAEVKQVIQNEPEAPAEFSAAGKNAWKSKDVTGIQKEFRRIHDSRTAEISRAQKAEREAREEGKTWRELGDMAKPYIESRGAQGVTPQAAMMEALALINEFKKGDPQSVKAELKRIGIDLDRAPVPAATSLSKEVADEIKSLQEFKEEYKKEKETSIRNGWAQKFETAFDIMKAQKTRTGELVFPDLFDESEKGIKRATRIGSRTQDLDFQQEVLDRFPGADFTVLVREAYKAEYGRVSGEPVQVSEKNQQHIQKSRRAAAATPGRTAPRVSDSNLSGKLSNRAALIKAIELNREH